MIVIAVQNAKQNRVNAYNENGKFLDEVGQLYNYTANFVCIKRSEVIYIYDESGKIIKRYPNDFIDIPTDIL